MRRVLIGLALAVLLALVGAVGGGLVAQATASDTGFGAVADALGYIALGAALGVVVAVVVAARLPARHLRAAGWVAAAGVLLLAVYIGVRLLLRGPAPPPSERPLPGPTAPASPL